MLLPSQLRQLYQCALKIAIARERMISWGVSKRSETLFNRGPRLQREMTGFADRRLA